MFRLRGWKLYGKGRGFSLLIFNFNIKQRFFGKTKMIQYLRPGDHSWNDRPDPGRCGPTYKRREGIDHLLNGKIVYGDKALPRKGLKIFPVFHYIDTLFEPVTFKRQNQFGIYVIMVVYHRIGITQGGYHLLKFHGDPQDAFTGSMVRNLVKFPAEAC